MKNKHLLLITIFCFSFVILFSFLISLSQSFGRELLGASASATDVPVVILDAGHGGEDGGAVGADGTEESEINLCIALKLQKIMEMYGYRVIMTRTQDIMTCDDGLNTIRSKKISDIHNRFHIIEENPDALFVSIHQNKYHDASQHGAQIFYSKNNGESKVLASSIQNAVKMNLQPDNKRAIKQSGTEIYLLYNAQSPAVLVECGFVSNYNELQQLKNDDYQTKLAVLIADGIINYKLNR